MCVKCVSRQNMDVPQREALVPKKEALVPQKEALVPQREALVHQKGALMPQKKALVPHKEALVPQKAALVPLKEYFAFNSRDLCLAQSFCASERCSQDPTLSDTLELADRGLNNSPWSQSR